MTLLKLFAVGAVFVSVCVAFFAFRRGERKRQSAGPPSPLGSIGEGLRLAQQHPSGKLLVLFTQPGDPVSEALEGSWLRGELAARLALPDRSLVVLHGDGDDPVLGHLYLKYTQRPRPQGASALVLDGEGKVLNRAQPQQVDDLLELLGGLPA